MDLQTIKAPERAWAQEAGERYLLESISVSPKAEPSKGATQKADTPKGAAAQKDERLLQRAPSQEAWGRSFLGTLGAAHMLESMGSKTEKEVGDFVQKGPSQCSRLPRALCFSPERHKTRIGYREGIAAPASLSVCLPIGIGALPEVVTPTSASNVWSGSSLSTRAVHNACGIFLASLALGVTEGGAQEVAVVLVLVQAPASIPAFAPIFSFTGPDIFASEGAAVWSALDLCIAPAIFAQGLTSKRFFVSGLASVLGISSADVFVSTELAALAAGSDLALHISAENLTLISGYQEGALGRTWGIVSLFEGHGQQPVCILVWAEGRYLQAVLLGHVWLVLRASIIGTNMEGAPAALYSQCNDLISPSGASSYQGTALISTLSGSSQRRALFFTEGRDGASISLEPVVSIIRGILFEPKIDRGNTAPVTVLAGTLPSLVHALAHSSVGALGWTCVSDVGASFVADAQDALPTSASMFRCREGCPASILMEAFELDGFVSTPNIQTTARSLICVSNAHNPLLARSSREIAAIFLPAFSSRTVARSSTLRAAAEALGFVVSLVLATGGHALSVALQVLSLVPDTGQSPTLTPVQAFAPLTIATEGLSAVMPMKASFSLIGAASITEQGEDRREDRGVLCEDHDIPSSASAVIPHASITIELLGCASTALFRTLLADPGGIPSIFLREIVMCLPISIGTSSGTAIMSVLMKAAVEGAHRMPPANAAATERSRHQRGAQESMREDRGIVCASVRGGISDMASTPPCAAVEGAHRTPPLKMPAFLVGTAPVMGAAGIFVCDQHPHTSTTKEGTHTIDPPTAPITEQRDYRQDTSGASSALTPDSRGMGVVRAWALRRFRCASTPAIIADTQGLPCRYFINQGNFSRKRTQTKPRYPCSVVYRFRRERTLFSEKNPSKALSSFSLCSPFPITEECPGHPTAP